MPLASCERCGKLFSKTSLPICPKCEPAEESDYEKVREAIEKAPDRTAEQLAEDTGVDLACVLRLVETGRVRVMGASDQVRCGRCGAPAISFSKRLCQACLDKLNQELADEQAKIRLPKRKDVQIGGYPSISEEEAARTRKSRGLGFRNRIGP
mgnify:CR=1 FL=1